MADLDLRKVGQWMNDQLGSPTREEVMEERRAFLETVRRTSSSSSHIRAIAWAAAALAIVGIAISVAVWFFSHSSSGAHRTLVIEPSFAEPTVAPRVAGHRIRMSGNGDKTIVFDSGSTFSLGAKSDAVITHNTAEEVRLQLDAGHVDCAINGNGYTKWHVNAGQYTVEVTGTRFSVDWIPNDNHLNVMVTEGSVLVRGGELNAEGIRLSMGETVAVFPDSVRIGKVNNNESVDQPLAKIPTRESAGALHGSLHQTKTKASKPLSYNQLWSESKKARYDGDHESAYRLLTELRTRFAGKPYARQSAFILGRICLESRQSPMEAKQWFETYLQSTPNGPLVEESMGRLIRVCDQLHHPCAKRYATQYLSQYPNGVFAEIATSVIE